MEKGLKHKSEGVFEIEGFTVQGTLLN